MAFIWKRTNKITVQTHYFHSFCMCFFFIILKKMVGFCRHHCFNNHSSLILFIKHNINKARKNKCCNNETIRKNSNQAIKSVSPIQSDLIHLFWAQYFNIPRSDPMKGENSGENIHMPKLPIKIASCVSCWKLLLSLLSTAWHMISRDDGLNHSTAKCQNRHTAGKQQNHGFQFNSSSSLRFQGEQFNCRIYRSAQTLECNKKIRNL